MAGCVDITAQLTHISYMQLGRQLPFRPTTLGYSHAGLDFPPLPYDILHPTTTILVM